MNAIISPMRKANGIAITIAAVAVLCCSTLLVADCTQELCHEVTYYGSNLPDVRYCRDFSTDGTDMLLGPNTCGLMIRMTGMQEGGTLTIHPSLNEQHREWTTCTFDCAPYAGADLVKATVAGTAGNYSGWFKASYCDHPGT